MTEQEKRPKIEERESPNPEFDWQFEIKVDDDSISAVYVFDYKVEGEKVDVLGGFNGGNSQIEVDEDEFAAKASRQGRKALRMAILQIKQQHPNVNKIDLKPDVLKLRDFFAAWYADHDLKAITIWVDEELGLTKHNDIISEEEAEKLRRYIGQVVDIQKESRDYEFSAGSGEWAKSYLGYKGGRFASPEEIEHSEGLVTSTGAFGKEPPVKMQEVELGRIRIASTWVPEGEWIPFMKESRHKINLHLSGGDCYQVEIIRSIKADGELIYEKSIGEVKQYFPEDITEKLRSNIYIDFPGPSDDD